MANIGLIASGAIMAAFAILFLNPGFEIPGMTIFHSSVVTNTSIEWGAAFVIIFVTVFLTGAVMMSKGFMERNLVSVNSSVERQAEAEGIRQ